MEFDKDFYFIFLGFWCLCDKKQKNIDFFGKKSIFL